MFDLFGVAVAGGMFVVPLYAFLQITVPPSATARTIAANNIVNSAFMVIAALLATLLASLNFTVSQILLLVAVGGVMAAWIAWRLHCVCEVTSGNRSEEHTSELQSLMRISYADFCLKKKHTHYNKHT